MKNRHEIICELRVATESYDTFPPGHEMRTVVMEKINTLRWVLGLPPVRTQPGGGIIK